MSISFEASVFRFIECVPIHLLLHYFVVTIMSVKSVLTENPNKKEYTLKSAKTKKQSVECWTLNCFPCIAGGEGYQTPMLLDKEPKY